MRRKSWYENKKQKVELIYERKFDFFGLVFCLFRMFELRLVHKTAVITWYHIHSCFSGSLWAIHWLRLFKIIHLTLIDVFEPRPCHCRSDAHPESTTTAPGLAFPEIQFRNILRLILISLWRHLESPSASFIQTTVQLNLNLLLD